MLFKFYCNISTYQILSSLWAITMEVGGSNPIRQRCSFDEEGEVHFFLFFFNFIKVSTSAISTTYFLVYCTVLTLGSQAPAAIIHATLK